MMDKDEDQVNNMVTYKDMNHQQLALSNVKFNWRRINPSYIIQIIVK